MYLTIEKLVYGGDGLARLAPDERGRRKTVFVPFVLEGEQVEAELVEQKAEFARARLHKVLSPSPARIDPGCPYFLRCGGCHYQHATYEHQLQIKAAILQETLSRIAKISLQADLQLHASPPWNYRNRTRLRVRAEPKFELGYFRFGSHTLLPVEQCPISSPLINRAIAALWQLGRSGRITRQIAEIEFFANAEDTQLQIELYGPEAVPPPAFRRRPDDLKNNFPELAGVTWFQQRTLAEHSSAEFVASRKPSKPHVLCGSSDLLYKTSRATYRVSGGSFFQVNRQLIDELVNIVAVNQRGTTALDLYAGVGLFSVVLSREFDRVIAVESSPISHSDLTYNAPENVQAVHATTEDYLKNSAGNLQPDLLVVDPPRGGLGKGVADVLGQLRSPRVIYVSCDPSTLARDLRVLLDFGYGVQNAHLIDLFPQTYHVESVFHLAL